MNFCIDNDAEYNDCWIGKIPDKANPNKAVTARWLLRNFTSFSKDTVIVAWYHVDVENKTMEEEQ